MGWLDRQLWLSVGSNVFQWVTSPVAIVGWALYLHARFGEDRCEHCWRKGVVPATGSEHKHCKAHAREHGTTHS